MDSEIHEPQIIQATPLQQMFASCTGAILTSLMVTPLDVVKIRLQAQSNLFSKGKCFVYSNGLMDHVCVCEEGNKVWYKKPGRFHGTLDAFLKIVRNEGIKSLWSGLPPTLVMAIPATVIYFTCYDQLSAHLRSKLGENENSIPIIAGIVARFGAVTVISPLELIRTKMQSKKFSYKELHQFVSKKVSEDGLISLWRGWAPTVLRDVPFSAMYWYNYEILKKWLLKKSGLHEPTFMINFASGALSGSIAAVVTLPFDVVKTQKQTQLWIYENNEKSISSQLSTWVILKNIVARNGFSGLFTAVLYGSALKNELLLALLWGPYGILGNQTQVSRMQGKNPTHCGSGHGFNLSYLRARTCQLPLPQVGQCGRQVYLLHCRPDPLFHVSSIACSNNLKLKYFISHKIFPKCSLILCFLH